VGGAREAIFLKRSAFFSFVGSDENKRTARNEFFMMRIQRRPKQ
jgi:hypothetical protein